MSKYSKEAVDREIAKDKRIKRREAKLIHALLKGRTMDDYKSWKAEVQADSSGTWANNAIRLPTKEQAEGYGRDLMMRWTAVREMRVVQSKDPINYDWVAGQLVGRDLREVK